MRSRMGHPANFLRLFSIVTVLVGLVSISAASGEGGALAFVEALFDNTILDGANSVALSPDGHHVYVTAGDDAALTVFERSVATGVLSLVESHQDGVLGVDGLAGAKAVTLSPDGRHVYVAGSSAGAVAIFGRDVASGELTFVEAVKDTDPGVDGLFGASSVAVSPDGDHVYVAGTHDDAVAVFTRDVPAGTLSFVEMEQDVAAGGSAEGLDGAYAVAVSPDGDHVYVAGIYDDAVVILERNATTGALSYLGRVLDDNQGGTADGLDGAAALVVSADGDHVYVAGAGDNAVAVFSRDRSSGALTYLEAEKNGVGGVNGLSQAMGIAVSPDGHHVFATGQDDDALVVFERDSSTGALTYGETHQDGAGGAVALNGATSVAVSPDGDHVYAAAKFDNGVTLFRRAITTGGLTFVEMQQDENQGGSADGLDGAFSVAVSPDGHHVYVVGDTDDAVAAFSWDGSTGALTYVEREKDGEGDVDGLNGARSVAVSPDGHHVYVTGQLDDAVAVFSRDWATGALTYVERQKDGEGAVDGLDRPRSVIVSPDGHHVYVASFDDSAVAVFGRNGSTGALTYVETQQDGVGGVDGLSAAIGVAVSPDGHHVYVTGYWDDAVAVFSRDGSTGALTYVEREKDGQGGVDGLEGANSVAISPDGSHVYVTGLSEHAVAVFDRNVSTGELTYVQAVKDTDLGVDGLVGAHSVAVSRDGDHVYVASYWDDAVAVFSRDGSTGALTFLQVVKDTDPGVDGLDNTLSVAVSPDGEHVFVAGAYDDAVVVFARNRTVGGLALPLAHGHTEGLGGALGVAVSPDGDHVFATGQDEDTLVVFERNAATGRLVYLEMEQDGVGGVDGLYEAYSVATSPDGAHVYVAGRADDAVAVFSHSGVTGLLGYVERAKDGEDGVDGLNGARCVAVSPDGLHVYVAGHYDDAVAVFSRDGATGALTYVERKKDEEGDVHGLWGASSVAVSPDGVHVYAAGWYDNAVEVFWRNPTTGELSYLGGVRDGIGSVDGLWGASSVAVSPDGSHVYAAGFDDDAVAVFGRNESTGALTFVEMEQDDNQGGSADGLDGPELVIVSPDGARVFVASRWDSAVAVFGRDLSTGALTYVEAEKDGEGGVDGLDGASSVAVSPDGEHIYVTGYYDDAVAVFGWQYPVYLPLVLRSSS